MRQIKFRGKSIKTNLWIYGYLLRDTRDGYSVIIPTNGWGVDGQIEVVPETVGQFTGLYDKDGKEVYENDIIEYSVFVPEEYRQNFSIVEFRDGMFTAPGLSEIERRKAEVIGNKFENPELI